MIDNEKLIKQCQKKSHKAFDELYKTYSAVIFGICLRYTKDRTEAEDLLQECFIKILNKIDDYKFQGSFEGWLKRLTVNTAINYIKAKKKFSFDEINDINIEFSNDDINIIESMEAEEIINLINQLPVGYRTVFNMYVIEGYKHSEIAEILGISDITSRTQLKKARETLINMIKGKKNK